MASFTEQGAQVEADWLARQLQTLGAATALPRIIQQVAELTIVDLLELKPASVGYENYQEHFNSFANAGGGSGTYNHAYQWGFNAGRHSGGPVVPGRPSAYMGIEDNYYDDTGDNAYGVECYFAYWSPDGTSVQLRRPFYARIQADNAKDRATIFHEIGGDGQGSWSVRTAQPTGPIPLLVTTTNVQVTGHLSVVPGGDFTCGGAIIGNSGANKNVLLFPAASSGSVVLTDSAVANNNLVIDNSGNITTRDATTLQNFGATGMKLMGATTQKLGLYGATPVVRQTVTGSRGGNAALASLLTALAAWGAITDSTTA